MGTEIAPEFVGFRKIPRLSRPIVITEKIDGTLGLVHVRITPGGGTKVFAGSKSRWITPEQDNHGFAKWVHAHAEELGQLGDGYHFGEWWGKGINRGYGIPEKRFSLFNVSLWGTSRPECCSVVPTLWTGLFNLDEIQRVLTELATSGSQAAPGFMRPEGIVIYHVQGNLMFKKTILHDEQPKGDISAEIKEA